MFLFVQDNVELTYSRGHGSPGATYSDSAIAELQRKIQRENDSAEYLQKALTSALAEDRMDDFKAIWDTVREFESTATYKKIVFRDRFLVKYFLGDYEFLCNLDSVKKYNPSKYVDGVFGATALEKIATQRTSGELEKKIGRIADEADRVALNRNLDKNRKANKVYISNQGATLWQNRMKTEQRNVAA